MELCTVSRKAMFDMLDLRESPPGWMGLEQFMKLDLDDMITKVTTIDVATMAVSSTKRSSDWTITSVS